MTFWDSTGTIFFCDSIFCWRGLYPVEIKFSNQNSYKKNSCKKATSRPLAVNWTRDLKTNTQLTWATEAVSLGTSSVYIIYSIFFNMRIGGTVNCRNGGTFQAKAPPERKVKIKWIRKTCELIYVMFIFYVSLWRRTFTRNIRPCILYIGSTPTFLYFNLLVYFISLLFFYFAGMMKKLLQIIKSKEALSCTWFLH